MDLPRMCNLLTSRYQEMVIFKDWLIAFIIVHSDIDNISRSMYFKMKGGSSLSYEVSCNIMFYSFIPLLVLVFVPAVITSNAPSGPHQRPLKPSTQRQNFVASSIFTPYEDELFELEDPVGLKPTFEWRTFSDDRDDIMSGSGGTFAHLPAVDCFDPESDGTFDVAIVGHPFDLGVTYRPGARFGPNAARQGARRMSPAFGWRQVRSWE